ncbi:hypothetical protein KIH79_03380 [Bifidobacterium sp. 82T10]|uniref:Uncharacterized protein n=1 Tax=Bifidobacterium miconis TaxID=2834435 RepID=A0ABS6WD85_9BIFI|nr:hypothetical protein [Bifidobacterium miconis]MBW3092009.1 hypothetical protein [Bifidobacterium miconis]
MSEFHLKNVNGEVDRNRLNTVMLEDGVIDWAAPLRALDVDVPVLLEYPIADDDAVAGQLEQVRTVLDGE